MVLRNRSFFLFIFSGILCSVAIAVEKTTNSVKIELYTPLSERGIIPKEEETKENLLPLYSNNEVDAFEEEYTEEERSILNGLIDSMNTVQEDILSKEVLENEQRDGREDTVKGFSLLRMVRFKNTKETDSDPTFFQLLKLQDSKINLPFQEVIPAGTRLILPREFLEQYQKQSKHWEEGLLNYLSQTYALEGPSMNKEDNEQQSAHYLPLMLEDQQVIVKDTRIMLIDMMNLRPLKPGQSEEDTTEKHVFVTLYDTKVKHVEKINRFFLGFTLQLSF